MMQIKYNTYNIHIAKDTAPIYIIGAGGIVNDAHLPAYKLANFKVEGIYDIDKAKAVAIAKKWNIPQVFDSLDEMITKGFKKVVYDVALPGSATAHVLQQLPEEAFVLIQKPMGENLQEAEKILTISRQRKQVVGVNFQLRYAPYVNAAREMITNGAIGALCDVEFGINVFTPWHLWEFLYHLPRVEILYHSIHYIDLVRTFLGNPKGIVAKTFKHPSMPQMASVKSNIIMDYGSFTRVHINTNHGHQYGLSKQNAYIKFEGTEGAIKITLGALMNYPKGVDDTFEYVIHADGHEEQQWKTLPVDGSWFPHAFIGSMNQLMLAKNGEIDKPDNSVEDCIYTMACVEAAYESNETDNRFLQKVF